MSAMDQVQLKGILEGLRKNKEDAGKKIAVSVLQSVS